MKTIRLKRKGGIHSRQIQEARWKYSKWNTINYFYLKKKKNPTFCYFCQLKGLNEQQELKTDQQWETSLWKFGIAEIRDLPNVREKKSLLQREKIRLALYLSIKPNARHAGAIWEDKCDGELWRSPRSLFLGGQRKGGLRHERALSTLPVGLWWKINHLKI